VLAQANRTDAQLSGFYAFVRGNDLVLALCTNPAIPADVTQYIFPSDLTFRINIDHHSQVTFDNASDLKTYGGTVVHPNQIKEDIVFQITFNDQGAPQLKIEGMPSTASVSISLFTGLRDDPFILQRWDGTNTAAIVLEMPLSLVLKSQSTLLLWATSHAPIMGNNDPFQDLDGRALRSQSNNALNSLPPSQHTTLPNVTNPDVMIYDTSRPALFPNGCELADDVVNISRGQIPAGGYRKNDVPFLDTFPYLAPPHVK